MSHDIEDIDNFLQLSDLLATAGQPTREQYPAIAAAGYRVVINLARQDLAKIWTPEPIWQDFIDEIAF